MTNPSNVNLSDVNFFGSEFKQNPYPLYEKMATENPVYKLQMPDGRTGWLINSYDLCVRVLKDNRFAKDMRKIYGIDRQMQGPASFLAYNMLSFDAPEHTRLRALVSKAFTPRLVENLKPRIQEIADDLLDKVQNQGHMELLNDYAVPLPIIVICEMLGISADDRERFRSWTQVIVNVTGVPNAETGPAIAMFAQYLGQLFEKRRQAPQDDLISALLQAESDGQKMTTEELYSMVILLLIAGHETTVNLIGNGMLALLEHPDQLEKLKNNPALIDSAIEEFLRYNGPVEWSTMRFASEDLELEGQQIARGDTVFVALAAADHDPSRFSSPDDLDIEREINNHLAFGMGIHYCLGAPLARLEGQIAIPTLLRRMPNIKLAVPDNQIVWRQNILLRGMLEMPVTF